MINFGSDYIDNLNRTSGKGKLIKAVDFVESLSPLVVKYWADHEDPFIFEGHTYERLGMFWEGVTTSVGMSTEGATVALSNVGNIVIKYLKEIDPSGMAVTLKLLPYDLLSVLTPGSYWKRYGKVIGVRADINAAVWTIGRELGKNQLPRETIMEEEAS